MGGEDDREATKEEGAADAVSQRFLLMLARQAQHEHREHHRVVSAEETFEDNEQQDRDDIGEGEIHEGARRLSMTHRAGRCRQERAQRPDRPSGVACPVKSRCSSEASLLTRTVSTPTLDSCEAGPAMPCR